jgi:hypothetical protein
MSKGDIVSSPSGEMIVLIDVGQRVLLDNPVVRVWDVALDPSEIQPWHLHHNPYVVLSLEASPGRMDWLDGSESRYLDEYVGGAVYRPTSPVHRLTNIGDAHYRNHLVEFKDLGEKRDHAVDIGPGERSVPGARPPGGPEADGRERVIDAPHVRVWEVLVPAQGSTRLELTDLPHLTVPFVAPDLEKDPAAGVAFHAAGEVELFNPTDVAARYFVVELTYIARLESIVADQEKA